MYKTHFFVFAFLFFVWNKTHAQATNEQIWNEYMLNYPFAKNWNMENAFTYSTLLNTPKWHAFDYSLTAEYSISKYVDVMVQGIASWTLQNQGTNTLELRPAIGSRIYFTPDNRVQTRLFLRLEQRNFKDLDTKTWTAALRPRLRGEVIVPLNTMSYSMDKQWYGLSTIELLGTTSEVKERFANRFRVAVGGGYRLNYTLRFEFIYMLQRSRQYASDNFESSDNIFRFRVKHFLRKHAPAKTEGASN